MGWILVLWEEDPCLENFVISTKGVLCKPFSIIFVLCNSIMVNCFTLCWEIMNVNLWPYVTQNRVTMVAPLCWKQRYLVSPWCFIPYESKYLPNTQEAQYFHSYERLHWLDQQRKCFMTANMILTDKLSYMSFWTVFIIIETNTNIFHLLSLTEHGQLLKSKQK